ncbi:DNA cytosine methyltransferase, partial [Campylobacter jejuni]|nr:DNA cytosine methyltransferase [Campylobacter jejuni]
MREFKFIDLFAGIGGFRLALESLGAKCVFSAEIDPHAIQTYKENFNDDPTCDITKLDPKRIPDFDILCAGFPCQAFSISGKQKGFSDTTRGTLFFDICRILKEKQPTAFILENVQNLEKHDKGNTLFVMINSLNDLGYSVTYKVLNAKDFGVPQNRERIIIIGNKEHKVFSFKKLYKTPVISMYDMLDKDGDFEYLQAHEYTLLEPKFIKTQAKSGLIFTGYRNKTIRTNGTKDGTNHLSRVHKQPNRIYSSLGIHPTIASQE